MSSNSHPAARIYTAQSVIGEVPSWRESLPFSAKGEELARLFEQQADLPGVILLEDQGQADAAPRFTTVSRKQFLQLVGRRFGIELYYNRPLRTVADALRHPPLQLPPDCLIQEAVDRCLARPEELIYEPALVRDPEDPNDPLRLVDFEDLLLASARVAYLRNQQMGRILDTVAEGLFLIDREHRIASEHSLVLETLLDSENLAGRRLPDVLAAFLPAALVSQTSEYLDALFNSRLIDRLVKGINPIRETSLTYTDAKGRPATRHLAFAFERIKEDGQINRILVRVEDITRRVQLQQEIEAKADQIAEERDLMLQIVAVEPGAMGHLLRGLESTLAEAQESLAALGDDLPTLPQRIQAILRPVHGLKGEAGLLRLPAFEDRLHSLEDRLQRFSRISGEPAPDALAPALAELRDLERLANSTRTLIARLRSLTQAVDSTAPENSASSVPELSASSALPVLPAAHQLLETLVERTGKRAALHHAFSDNDLPDVYRPLLREIFVQLVRNSLVHGIEPPETRAALGKNPEGVLQLALNFHPDLRQMELIFQDDGAGLDLPKLRALAAANLGWPADLPDEQVKFAIFQPGLSTASENPTLDAGRGVGLDLIWTRVGEAGGQIIPHSSPGAYTAFQIVLPLPEKVST